MFFPVCIPDAEQNTEGVKLREKSLNMNVKLGDDADKLLSLKRVLIDFGSVEILFLRHKNNIKKMHKMINFNSNVFYNTFKNFKKSLIL